MRALALLVLAHCAVACREPPPAPAAPATAASAQPSTAPSENAMPAVGSPAPPLVATASDGTKIDLAAMKGEWVVLYFYPKDDTPGCTKEACAFRDAWSKLTKANVRIVGISRDDDASHKAFASKYELPFPLVADVDGSIAQRFGVPLIKNQYTARVTFLVGPDGKIAKVYPKVDPALHAQEILSDVGAAT